MDDTGNEKEKQKNFPTNRYDVLLALVKKDYGVIGFLLYSLISLLVIVLLYSLTKPIDLNPLIQAFL